MDASIPSRPGRQRFTVSPYWHTQVAELSRNAAKPPRSRQQSYSNTIIMARCALSERETMPTAVLQAVIMRSKHPVHDVPVTFLPSRRAAKRNRNDNTVPSDGMMSWPARSPRTYHPVSRDAVDSSLAQSLDFATLDELDPSLGRPTAPTRAVAAQPIRFASLPTVDSPGCPCRRTPRSVCRCT